MSIFQDWVEDANKATSKPMKIIIFFLLNQFTHKMFVLSFLEVYCILKYNVTTERKNKTSKRWLSSTDIVIDGAYTQAQGE